MAFTVIESRRQSLSADELRALAPAPAFPHTWDDALGLSSQLDAWLKDHFGLRSTLIHAYAILTQGVLHTGNDAVFIGRDGMMFLLADNNALRQSAGLVRRDKQVTETADMLAAMKDVLASRGAQLVFASPPNSATIYGDYLPRWAQNQGQPTEQDLLLTALAARGIKTVYLRPVLWAERARGKVYHLHDSHWTTRGAIAGFNAIAAATSHADWRFDMAAVLAPPVNVTGGDLARMVGISGDVSESDQFLTLPYGRRETFPEAEAFPTYTETLGRPGLTILIIGDSFTYNFFEPLMAQRVGRVIWTHHRLCDFDWKWVEQFQPDEVWWIPTERYILCSSGVRPRGFPSKLAASAGR